MLSSPEQMRKATESMMWNNPTHAMSDISSLAYRRNVPASELIVPAGMAGSAQKFEPTRKTNCQSTIADVSWNTFNGIGRGALLQNRDALHRNDQELKRQLRFANGLGYSNDLIEAKFQNSSPPRSLVEDNTTAVLTSYQNDDLNSKGKCNNFSTGEDNGTTSPEKEEIEDISTYPNGEWNWETRTKPPTNRLILKNVALQSLKRKNQKAKPVEENVPIDVVAPAELDQEFSPYLLRTSTAPKVREDWRAENKAAEEARRSQVPEADALTASPKAKKGWRSGPSEPLLGDLKIDSDWSNFAPNKTMPFAEENHSQVLLPTPEPGLQTAVECPAKSLLELSGMDLQQQKAQKKKKKKNQNIRIMFNPPAERSYPEPNVAPPGYLMPINGVSPMAFRNSENKPLAGQKVHHTFSNLFEQTIKQLGTQRTYTYKKSEEFSLFKEEFPRLK